MNDAGMSGRTSLAFLVGGGEMGALMRAHDWSTSSLGKPEEWPTPLRTIVGVLLAANQPMFVAWGPEWAMLYNDAYAEILGAKHPAALGRPFSEVWHELAEDVEPIMRRAYAGEPTAMDVIPLVLVRHGYPEETYFSFFYAPLRDENGAVGGVYCACAEITARVFAERHTAFRLALDGRLRDLADPTEVMAAAADALGIHLGVARVGYAEVDGQGWASVEREWNSAELPTLVGRHWLEDYGPTRLADMQGGRSEVIADFDTDPRHGPSEAAIHHGLGIGAQIVVPLVKEGRLAALLFVHHASPRRWHADEVAAVEDAAERTWAAVERARAERALRESEARLAALFEQAPTFMVLLDGPEHRFVRINPGYMRLVGGRPVLGRTVAEALPEATEQGFVALLDRVYRTGEPFAAVGIRWAMEETPERPAHEMFVDLAYQPIRNAAGTVTGIFVEGADVTERVRATAALHESDVLGRQILDGAADYAIVSTGLDGRVTRWNEGARRLLGWKEEEMRGETLHRLFTPEDAAAGRVEAEMRDALATGRVASDMPQLRRSGERFPASCALTPLRDEAGQAVGFVKVLRDRTEDQRREGRLALFGRASAGLLEASDADAVLGPLLEEGADVLGYDQAYVYSITPDGAHLSLTHSFGVGERVRASLACAPFSSPLCGIVADTRRPLILSNLLATTDPRLAPGRAAGLDAYAGYPIFADGRVVAVIAFGARARPAFAAAELDLFATLARFLAVVRERLGREAALERGILERTAELHEREEQLRQAQKMEAVGQLTGGLAHDFNNLLTGITGSLELLQTRVAQGRIGEVDRYVGVAQGAAKRAAALTHRLLAFSRRQTLDPKPTDVNRLVRGMEELVRRTVGPGVEVEPVVAAAGLWTTLVDPGQLENALLNLCINARDAMPDGGKITIETANHWMDARTARDRGLAPGQYVSLCVSDTGTGMSTEVMARAFDPFFTTKPIGMGTGLGLSMIYGFANQSGGQARIYSEVGMGTMVCLYLPRHVGPGEASALTPEPSLPARAEQGETVLVVDDEPSIRMLVAEVLKELGYTAIEAADGPAGLEVLRSDVRLDLLVTDVGLPGGMNGRQVADAARALRPGLKVLFITGYAENAVLSHGHLEPGMHVLTKPFAMEALAGRVKDILAEAEASR